MQITFLGTASCYPTSARGVSCTALRFEDGEVWLFDCGEGSQIQLQRTSIHPRRISKIFITHLHGDHLFGLPGLICTLGNQVLEKKNFILQIYGPLGIRRYVRESLCLSRSPLPFKYMVNELIPVTHNFPDEWDGIDVCEECSGPLHPQEILGDQILPSEEVWSVYSDEKVIVRAAELQHRIPSFGYVIKENSTPGQLNIKFLQEKGLQPGPLYGKLKSGCAITLENGDVIRPEDVLGSPKPGRLITILGDTRDSTKIRKIAKGSDVLVHEATLEDSLKSKAIENGHSTPSMAAGFAASIEAKVLFLFHFSQRYKSESCKLKEGDSSVSVLLEEAKQALKNYEGVCEVKLADDFLEYSIKRPSQSG